MNFLYWITSDSMNDKEKTIWLIVFIVVGMFILLNKGIDE